MAPVRPTWIALRAWIDGTTLILLAVGLPLLGVYHMANLLSKGADRLLHGVVDIEERLNGRARAHLRAAIPTQAQAAAGAKPEAPGR